MYDTPKTTTDVLAQEIETLSQGVKKVLNGRLNERALIVLINDAMPPPMKSMTMIKEVLRAAGNLQALYLKKSKGDAHAE